MKFLLKLYVLDGKDRWAWQLSAADGLVCFSAGTFDTEADARADIARVKKKMAGAKFAKVVAP